MRSRTRTKTILTVLSDTDTLKIFRSVAQNLSVETTTRTKLNHLKKLARIGLIRKTPNGYKLSTFGFVVYQSINLIDEAIHNYAKLKTVDEIIYSENAKRKEMLKKLESALGIKIKGL